MKDLFGNLIDENCKGVLYLCYYDYIGKKLVPVKGIHFKDYFEAIDAFANIPNPASQVAAGHTKEEFEKELASLHRNMSNLDWQKELINYI